MVIIMVSYDILVVQCWPPQLKVGLYTLLGLAISIINNIVMGVKNKISYLGGGPTLYKYHNL